jgi:hypothetical protein
VGSSNEIAGCEIQVKLVITAKGYIRHRVLRGSQISLRARW